MIEWQGGGELRLRSWRQFRLTLNDLTPNEALIAINHEWAYCPFVNKYLLHHDIINWPDPWTLLSEGKFCSLAISLGIIYTIVLCEHFNNADLRLDIYTNIAGEYYNLVIVNNTDVLNYVHDSIIKIDQIEQGLSLQYSYGRDDLHTANFK